MQTWRDDEFLLGLKFYGVQTLKGFHELFSWNFSTSGDVMHEQFMSDFTHRDSAPRPVQLFISVVNFRAISLLPLIYFFHLQWY